MSYLVLARKHRPQRFDEIVGQEHVTTTLINAIEGGRVAHGYLFCGARGVGKTTAARILAKALNCREGPTPTPCGTCDSCVEIGEGRSLDVAEVDGASNRGIDQIRELRDTVRFRPARDRAKVTIIDEVHMLTTEAFNALLKTLEEPPDHVHFLFATTEPHKIPVTILSRCQRFDFRRVSSARLVAHMEHILSLEGITADTEALHIIAREAEGSVRDALSLLDRVIAFGAGTLDAAVVREALGVADRSSLIALASALLQGETGEALRAIDHVAEHGLDLQHHAQQLTYLLRDLLVLKISGAEAAPLDMAPEQRLQLAGLAASTSVDAIQWMVHRAVARLEEIARSPEPRVVFELLVVELARVSHLVGLDQLIARLEALERGRPLPPPPRAPTGQKPSVEHGGPATAPAPPAAASVAAAGSEPVAQSDAAPVATTAAEPAAAAATRQEPEPTPSPPETALHREAWPALLKELAEGGGPAAVAAGAARLLVLDRVEDGRIILTAAPNEAELARRFAERHATALAEAVAKRTGKPGLEIHVVETPPGEAALSPVAAERQARMEAETRRRELLEGHPLTQAARARLGARVHRTDPDPRAGSLPKAASGEET